MKAKQKQIESKDKIKKDTIRDMEELGIYKPQYERLVDVYAETYHQYLRAVEDFKESGYKYETETAAGNPKKSGIMSTLENVRKDILQYSDRLGLNPRSLENVTAESNSKSTLATVISELSGR